MEINQHKQQVGRSSSHLVTRVALADPGEGPEGARATPLFLNQTEKRFFETAPTPLLSEGLDPRLDCIQ